MNYEAGRIEGGEPVLLTGPDDSVPRRRRRIVIAVVAVLGLAVLAWFLFGRDKAVPAKTPDQLPSVSVVVPGRQTIDRSVTVTGTLAARREMPIGVAGEGGMITRVLVEPGQWVGAGQVLATIDRSVQVEGTATLAAQIRVRQADATLAQSNLDRARALVANGFVSRADIEARTAARDAAVANVRVAQAQLAQQRAFNGRLVIRAPAAGLVLTRQAEPGQVVSAGSGVLFRMAEGGQMELRAQMAESDLIGLRPGARATVTPVGSARSFSGEVWQVSPVIDPNTRQGVARVALKYDPALRPGGFASAAIVGGATVAPLLPETAVQTDEKGNYIYLVDGAGKVQRRNIKVGQVSDAGVAVAEGLSGTERVVLSAGAFLNAGQAVRPVQVNGKAG
jgi:RND family efflux transporter MFP subunit